MEGPHRNQERIDIDGLPHVGAVIYPGQSYYSKVDCATGGCAIERALCAF